MRLLHKFCYGNSDAGSDQINIEIVDHLLQLFNSQVGYTSFEPAFGLRSFNGVQLSEYLIEQIKKDVEHVIWRWEKRFSLQHLEVIQQGKITILRLNGMIQDEKSTLDFCLAGR